MDNSQRILETIWRIPDALWIKLKPILTEYDPPSHTGRKRINARAALDAIIFRRRCCINVDLKLNGQSKLVLINKQSNHQIVHSNRLGKTNCFSS